jgi:hypothetical protein
MINKNSKFCAGLYTFYKGFFVFDYLLVILLPIVSYILSLSIKICQYKLFIELSTLVYPIFVLHLLFVIIMLGVAFKTEKDRYAPPLFQIPSHTYRHIIFIFINNVPLSILSVTLSRSILINNYRVICQKQLDISIINRALEEEPILKLYWILGLFLFIFILGTILRVVLIKRSSYNTRETKDVLV